MSAALATAVAWFAFVAHREVPILDLFDLAIHEVGHLLAAFMPRMVMFVAGSAAQVMVPLGLAWYFGVHRSDAAGGGFCLAWAGASLWDVSVYVADAPVQALPLIGGGQHDWAFLLGPQGWDVVHRADDIAGFFEFTGGVIAVTGILIAVFAAIQGSRRTEPTRAGTDREAVVARDADPWLAAARLPFVHERVSGD